MADKQPMVMFAASYDTVQAALEALDDIEQLHKDEMIGKFDAAVIDKGVSKALENADKVVKRTVDATADEIASELQEALKSQPAAS